MVVALYDQKSGVQVRTQKLKVQLDSGASAKTKKILFDIQTPFKVETKDDSYSAHYAYSAMNSEKKCVPKTRCAGWTLEGTYVVTSDKSGKNLIRVSARLSPPSKRSFNLRSMFGVSWTVKYAEKKAESYLVFWHPRRKAWVYKNWTRESTLKYAQQNALKGMRRAYKANNVWRSVKPFTKDNVLEVTAEREFKPFSGDSERNFSLLSAKDWFVGFFDMGRNVGATSEIMTLSLDSGKRE